MELEKLLSGDDTKKGRLQRWCLELLAEHERDGAIPTSIRFLFYELESRGIITKDYRYPDGSKRPRQPAQDVSDAVDVLRKCGLVPWSYIVDETRSLQQWRFAPSVYSYVLDTLADARIDIWDGKPPPLILCESRSLAGVLSPIARRYLCPIAATNGQVGGFLHTDVAPLIEESVARMEPRRVFYFGDLDLSGGHIEENTYKVLLHYGPLDWRRLAVTTTQVYRHNLTVIEKRDHRFKPAKTFPAVETEALKQMEIQRILREALDGLVVVSLSEASRIEEQQRVRVREALAHIMSSP